MESAQTCFSKRRGLKVKLGLLTSVETRHRYFANRLCDVFDVVAVVYEQTGYSPAEVDAADLTPQEAEIVRNHFTDWARQEALFFGDKGDFIENGTSCVTRRLAPGELNTAVTLDFLESAGVDTVAVFGTNLIRKPLLDRWPGRMVNMHLGLSPYYRGTATNFYPLLNEEPEYVGATIHLLDAGIDSGPILKHARPTIVADDGPHSIGCKAILAGIEAMIAVLHAMERGCLQPVPQWPVTHGRFCRRKEYHPRQVVELCRKIEGGLIPRYVQRRGEDNAHPRLIL